MSSKKNDFADIVWGVIWIIIIVLFVVKLSRHISVTYHKDVEPIHYSETRLKQDFVIFDDVYFGGELADNTSAVYIAEGAGGDLGDTNCDTDGKACSISVNSFYNREGRTAGMTLLHEMCHANLMTHQEFELDPHGPKWQACMHQLANEKAFDNLW